MRIAVVADLHIDLSTYGNRAVGYLRESWRTKDIDVICVLGDIGTNLRVISSVLTELEPLAKRRLFVAGNHDIWLDDYDVRRLRAGRGGVDSFEKLTKISEICAKVGWHDLMTGPYKVGDVGFVGNIEWYDYSLADSMLDVEYAQYVAKASKYGAWNDGVYVFFDKFNDVTFTQYCNDLLEKHLKELGNVSTKICCSHHIPFAALQKGMHPSGSFFNAFGGNRRFGEILVDNKVDISFSGHLHRNLNLVEQGVLCYQTSIGYASLWPEDVDWPKLLSERTIILDV